MIYTLNLFDILPDKVQLYRRYSIEAGKVIFGMNGKVVSSGWHPTTLRGEETRHYFIIVEFPDMEALEFFLNDPAHHDMHEMRENSTENYIWKIFEPWNLNTWVAFPGLR